MGVDFQNIEKKHIHKLKLKRTGKCNPLFEHHNIVVDEKYKDWLRQKGMTEGNRQTKPQVKNYVGSESNSLEHSVILLKKEDLVHFN